MTRPRAVLDCNVYFRAFLSPRSISGKVIVSAELNLIDLFVSRYTIAELRDVLGRNEFADRFLHFTPENMVAFLTRVRKCSRYVRSVAPVFELTRDKKDSPYIDLAVHVDAEYLVTHDRDLLDLMDGFDDTSKEFRQRFRHLKIVRPDDLLKIITDTGLSLEP